MPSSSPNVTQLLNRIDSGDGQAANDLIPLVIDELRRLANQMMAHERPGQTLQATALCNEAYLKLVGPAGVVKRWNGREHFFRVCAQAMRRILIDRARARKAAFRGGGSPMLPIEFDVPATREFNPEDHEVIDRVVREVSDHHPRWGELIDWHLYSGLPLSDIAQRWGTTEKHVVNERRFIIAVLKERLQREGLPAARGSATTARANADEA